MVEKGGGLRVAVWVRHLDREKSEIRGVVQWKIEDSRRGLYEFEMYRRRVEVSFSQVRREEKSKKFVEFNFWVEACANDATRR
jgi:hypothetical protein